MKNQHITTLEKVIPIELRLEVYKEALNNLENIKTSKGFYMSYNIGLCLLLPCILWDLEDYLDDMIDLEGNKHDWDHIYISTAFPELTKDIIEQLNNVYVDISHNTAEYKNSIRIEYLKQFIQEIESKLNPS